MDVTFLHRTMNAYYGIIMGAAHTCECGLGFVLGY